MDEQSMTRADERPGTAARTDPRSEPHDLACVIHVHSNLSDGTATVPEIIAAARATRTDVVLLTDHDSREAARRGLEDWHGDVLLLVGHEVTTSRGHLLAFDLEHEIDHRGLTESEIYERVRLAGGFAFAAHPFSRGGLVTSIIRPHPWPLADSEGCGIELWSLLTDVAERWSSPLQVLRFLLDPEAAMDGPPAEHLAQWDRLCAARRVPAIGGLDAHQSGFRVAGRVLSPMPNRRYFRLLRTHVLLDRGPRHDLRADRSAVYGALREGRCYLSVDALAPAGGFNFVAGTADGRTAAMGSEVGPGSWVLRARTPRPAKLRLLRAGVTVQETDGQSLEHEVAQAGAYRVEARLAVGGRERTWIVSNPIYVDLAGVGRH